MLVDPGDLQRLKFQIHLGITSQALSRSKPLIVNIERFTRFDGDCQVFDRPLMVTLAMLEVQNGLMLLLALLLPF